MEATQMEAVAEKIIRSGFENGASEDDIKMAMFSEKIPFSKLNTLYKTLAISLGFIVDPKVVTAAINTQVAESDWSVMETWEQVKASVDQIQEEVKGSTYMRIMQLVKPFCAKQGITLPVEEKATAGTRSRVGAVSVAAVDYFNGTTEPTKAGMFEVILPHVKAAKNARENTNLYFNTMWAVKNNIGIKDAAKITSGMAYPAIEEVAVAEPVEEVDMM